MRLDKVLTLAGYGSKRTIRRLLFSQQVRVDQEIVMQENRNVDPKYQVVTVGQDRVQLPASDQEVYYMLNKPRGVVSAVTDAKMPTVLDLIADKDQRPGLYPVGRLDGDTQGLLLITDNGRLGYRMLHPKFHVTKTYAVVVNGPLDQEAVASFEQGVQFLDGTVCQSAHLEIVTSSPECSRALVTLSEGRFHQVKKMFLSVGVKVTALTRVAFGPLHLDDKLQPGQYRPLNPSEMQALLEYFT